MEPREGFEFVYAPDLKVVSDLICKTWARPCWNYDEGLLKLHINRPSGDPELAVGQMSEDGRLASYQAFMPFDVNYYGKNYRAVFASFLTVSSEFHGKGLAGPQQGELLELAQKKGYDLYTTICEVGAASNRAVEKIFAKKNLDVKIVNVHQYLAAVSQYVDAVLPEAPSGKTRVYASADEEAVKPLMRSLGGDAPLKKIVPDNDIGWLLIDRPHTRTYVFEEGGRIRAMANLLLLEVLGTEENMLNVYFDNVNFGDLTSEEQVVFLGDVMLALKETGYHTALMPAIGYLPMEAFRALRFRAAPRQLNFYIAHLKADALPEGIREVDSLFMDIY